MLLFTYICDRASSLQRYLTSRRWLYWHLQKRGVRVIFWVLNEPEEFAQVRWPTKAFLFLFFDGSRIPGSERQYFFN